MIDRRTLIIWGGALLASPLLIAAQPQGRRYEIGLLLITSRRHPGADQLLRPFLLGMRELGYEEGGNLVIHWAEAEGRPQHLPVLAAQLAARKVHLIVAGGHEAALAARDATTEIPIVFVAARDPVGQGLVKSLSKPGGNLTGFAGEPLGGKWLELLRELAPLASRLAVIHVREDASFVEDVRKFAPALKFELLLREVQTETDLEDLLRRLDKQRPECLLVLGGVIAYSRRQRILDFAAARRLPAIYPLARWADDGGLISYGVNYSDNWRRTVAYADRILKGTRPAELPVQLPVKLELVINARTAKRLGLTIPQPVLLRADRLIE